MRVGLLLGKAKKIYREEGLTGTVTAGRKFLAESMKRGSYQSRRTDIEERFEMITTRLTADDTSLLDVGCADGRLTAKFTEEGMFAVGIDVSVSRVTAARKNHESIRGPNYILAEITPENVDHLPKFDVILLLTVYQHWLKHYGVDAADDMLRTLGEKCDKLFFEASGGQLDRPPIEGYDGDSIGDYYVALLESVFGEKTTIKHVGTASYMGGEREDPVLFIDCEGID